MRKVLVFLLGVVVLLVLLPSSAYAQYSDVGTSQSRSKLEAPLKSKDMNLESYVAGKELFGEEDQQGLLGITFRGITHFLVGAYDESGQAHNTGAAGNLVAFTDVIYISKPISSQTYLAHLNQKSLKIIQPAYAQGAGWDFLSPVVGLWEASRNLAYLFMAVVFIVIGFMIMFRSKIDPQTVISVQNALPKTVVTLLLITFSYAICGLVVDLAYLGNRMVQAVFENAFDTAFPHTTTWQWEANPRLTDYLSRFAGGGVLGTLGSALTNLTSFITNGDLNAIIQLVIAFSLVGALLKVFFSLLVQYLTLIFSVVLSPLVFLTSSFSKGGLGEFLRMIISAAATFPITLLVLNAASFYALHDPKFRILSPLDINISSSHVTQSIAGLNQLVALGLLMLAGQIPGTMKSVFKTKSTLGLEGIGEVSGALKKIPIIGGLF